jgi:Domain of unknown function (DUF4386)
MIMEKLLVNSADSNMKGLYRVGGISAIVLSISYIIITVLYVLGGALPGGGEEWLKHLAKHILEWRAITGFSVLTDFLFMFVLWSLYCVLKDVNKNATLAGIGFVGLFVVLDLAVTWPNYASLINLSSKYAAAINITERMTFVAAADYAFGVLSSRLFAVYAILVPALGTLIIGLVMLKGTFSKFTAYLGVVTGILGIISVVGPLFIAALGMTAIITSVFTTVWVLLVGFKLLKLSQQSIILES